TGTAFLGMGPTGAKATAPDNASAVMYAEVKYEYKPLIALKFVARAQSIIVTRAAFLVRDRRDLATGMDPQPVSGVTPSTC
ncbi:MAG TPA: pilus assembly protein, partial [Allosphingosinicella sp.]|nr:pilus assembly protein [Allosphingosinicella sp.]